MRQKVALDSADLPDGVPLSAVVGSFGADAKAGFREVATLRLPLPSVGLFGDASR